MPAAQNALSFLADKESNARTYIRHIDRVIAKGHLARVYDTDGREYIDCLACAGALPLGHNHPFVQTHIEEFLKSGHVLQALDMATPAKIDFVTQLYETMPAAFAKDAKIQFCGPSGADGVEAAIKLFKTATGRRSVLAFHGAYHGMTMGSLSLMGNLAPKTPVSGHMAEVQFLPYPYRYRSPFSVGPDETDRLSLNYIDNLLSDPESGVTKPALMLVEAVQGEGGCVPASAEWLRGLRDITARHDVPLVIDEVQTGIGRTGDMFAHEWARIVPDAIVMSKAIGGGFPLSLLAYHRKYDVWTPGAHAGTFRGNQIALVSGAATMKYILEERVLENVSKVGSALMEHFQALKGRYPCIGEVRGRGLMLGVELVDPLGRQDMIGHYPANGELARALKKNCLRHGLIVETGGRYGAVMRFLPPLIINRNDAVEIASRFEAALSEAWMNDRPAPLQPARRPSIERVE